MADTTLPGVLLTGDHASRPAANTVASGTLYACSTHGLIYQSDASAWSTWATLGGGAVDAADVTFTPAGTIASTDVQAAIEEVASEAGGGGAGWDLLINETGSSFAGFTAHAGTWASSAGVIQQTATGASVFRTRYDTRVPTSHMVVEVEVMFPTGGSTTRAGGIILGSPGTNSANYRLMQLLKDTTSKFRLGEDSLADTLDETVTVNLDTWYRITARVTGNRVDGYLDGTLIGGNYSDLSSVGDHVSHFVGLRAFDGSVHFRNFKLWALTLPS